MVMKNCTECGEPFDTRGRSLTCSDKCRIKSRKKYKLVYNAQYYIDNGDKWTWYRENTRFDAWGTGGLGQKATKEEDGTIDFHAEFIKVRKELYQLGLRK